MAIMSGNRMRTWQKVLIVALAVLVLLVGGTAGWFYWRWQQMQRPVVVGGTETPIDLPDPAPGEKINLLLMGVDARPGETESRSDTIIFVSVDTTRSEPAVLILSIPRDSRVAIPGYGIDKVNHAHSYGGIPLLLETVSQLLGQSIHYYVELNFEGFSRALDILGGVDLNVEERMYYPEEGIDLEPGLQHLDGEQCLAFVRYRYYPEGDIARVSKQQQFLSALIDQHFTLANVFKLPLIFSEITPYVSTNLPIDKALSLGNALSNMNMNQVQMQMVPGEATFVDEISYWIVDEAGLEDILFAWDNPPEPLTTTPSGGEPETGGDGSSDTAPVDESSMLPPDAETNQLSYGSDQSPAP
jgi:LCP family protein required for cell wall assembly